MTSSDKAPISLENAKETGGISRDKGKIEAATALLESSRIHESEELFAEVGKLTRQLHDSLNTVFSWMGAFQILATEDIP